MAALCCLMATACMNDNDDWTASDSLEQVSAFGNNALTETNVMTIKALTDKYKSVAFSSGDMKLVEEDIQIKGRVTGNDVGGNYYKKLTIQDETAAMTIDIDESGLWGYLPLGQQILVSLKGLYIGGYGKMPQIGVPYESKKGVLGIGRMPKTIWHEHFKVLKGDIKEVVPTIFDANFKKNMDENAGKLVIFKNVTFRGADGKRTLKDGPEAALAGYFQTWFVDDGSGLYDDNVVIFTSGSYAKFSTTVLPFDVEAGKAIPCNIIGVATRYNSTWQISIRQASDIQLDLNATPGNSGEGQPAAADATGTGTAGDPFNVAAAIKKCQEIGETASTEKYYVKGIVVKGGKASGGYGNVTFSMGDSPSSTDLFTAYQVAGTDGEKLADGYEVKVGDEVVVYGPIYNYKGNTPETAGKSAATIVTINGKKTNE